MSEQDRTSAQPPLDAMATIDPLDFRRVLGNFPTGVTVVAAAPDGQPAGMTVGSFFSISLDPPLVGLCAGKDSTSWPKIAPAERFSVNVLGAEQREVSNLFASPREDKFDQVSWEEGVTGSPLLDDALAHIECLTEQTVDSGDHWIVIGRVVSLDLRREGMPLVFFRGGYGTFSAEES